ncbi:GTPase HflX [Hyperthermus butylicus]|uniref:GTPase HflX n=1 Tax=Hyperthermus butylicus (strain DSM 5456 / JCM 9403 / PLM1-5) TaxID=415426 RepID=HFLX_HYPBU|nr:GTPase HflX [Hyperthermus butylicus]A2BLW4.1 RecName: Full=GTPase HflX; AltName: Full=GTP-binding protein HflX [Hyperthermus butylicus DSM 5456]ABM80975.1 GTPase [Hyperthermus butylicus DSM 5456]
MAKVAVWKPSILVLPRGLARWEVREAYVLAETAGYRVVDVLYYRRVSSSKLLSDAKLEELAEKAKSLVGNEYARIIVYDNLKPREYFRIVKATGVNTIDRTMLILEIFSLHAGSREAKLQIELARLRHELPLVREAIRLSKLKELPGFLGPGGYAIDAYYRYMVSRIAKIKRELRELRRRHEIERSKRRSAGLPHIAIVGYASAGKTSLFNAITGLQKPVGPEYFTTITPKRRAISFNGLRTVFIDTVGFIMRIPPEIIEAFHSTLEEAATADVILYVVDVSEPDTVIAEKLDEGLQTLRRIGVIDKPLIIAANKIDLVPQEDIERLTRLLEGAASTLYPALEAVIPVSAKTGAGVAKLLCRIATLLAGTKGSTC